MKEAIVQILTATAGTLGFVIYFRVSEKNALAAMLGGALSWIIYPLVFHFTDNIFISNFAAAAIVYFWSEIMARVLKAPSNIYLVPGIIPLLPGGAIYYTAKALVLGNNAQFSENGIKTLLITFGMAAGMVCAAVIAYYFNRTKKAKSIIKKKGNINYEKQ